MYNNSVFVHESYNDVETSNDIALINLPFKVTYTDFIRAVALPKKQLVYPLLHNDFVVATGWGKDRDNGQVTLALNFVELTTMKNTNCVRYYHPGVVKPNNICASTAGGKGTCAGDSGGPVVSRTKNYLIGVVSFGPNNGCLKGIPVAFTRVHAYIDWIQSKTGIQF